MIGPGITTIAPLDQARSPATLHVDVIADLVCPWCYLGKKRLDRALDAVHGPSLVNWFPFQLNPDMPENGMPFEEYLARKFGDPKTLEPGMQELIATGRQEGVHFRLDRIASIPNTLPAHLLMNFASMKGVDTSALADRVMLGFFTGGDDISNPDVLASYGAEFGLAEMDILAALEDSRAKNIVLAQESQVRQSGVTGVPDFLVNKRLFVVGAQSTDNLVAVFDRAMFGAESDLDTSETVH